MDELVGYLYRRQLAEADIIAVSKIDVIPNGVDRVEKIFSGVLPGGTLVGVSSISGFGIDPWLESVMTQSTQDRANLALDYQQYADAEAVLGWLNLSAAWTASKDLMLLNMGDFILRRVKEGLTDSRLKAAHIKMAVSSTVGQIRGSLVSKQGPIVWDQNDMTLQGLDGDFVLNARAEGSANSLSPLVNESIAGAEKSLGVNISIRRIEYFSPRPPKPTYRLSRTGRNIPLNELQLD